MRHPPRSGPSPGAAATAPSGAAAAPVTGAFGAMSARTVEHAVTGQRDDGLQGATSITDDRSAPSGHGTASGSADGDAVAVRSAGTVRVPPGAGRRLGPAGAEPGYAAVRAAPARSPCGCRSWRAGPAGTPARTPSPTAS
ncbi:hypothetical protein GCM10010358_27950 [Streptomyces minutiscleroticus]|uniref:Uncharacterized protein n=1 Tax=Streptomyces minutiscleroticus TaxID=68238 RepID=A0A918KQI8_9ACTN|nr:hypothetical protein [Streptomyces minutiscleroticus]GGX72016.1 hypothetical protein GCM10010358_27950 [Streptomyces minutiscleroticus]